MTNCNEFLMTTIPLGFQDVQAPQSIVCTWGGIDVQPTTRRIYLKVPRGILQLYLNVVSDHSRKIVLINQLATYNQQ